MKTLPLTTALIVCLVPHLAWGQTPPQAPALIAPSGPGFSDPLTLSWVPVAEGSQYYLWINNGAGQPVVQSYHDAATVCAESACTVSLGSSLGEGSYTWWIQASNSAGASPWSSSLTFAIGQVPGTPVLVSPAGAGQTSPVTFLWNALSGATQYYLWVNNGAGQSVVQTFHASASVCSSGTCSVSLGSSLPTGNYTWWIQGSNAVGAGAWSQGLSFAIGQPPGTPTLIAPTGVGQTSPVTFTWEPTADASQYYLWVNDGAGTAIVQSFRGAGDVCSVSVCTVTPALSFAEGQYTWWVQAINDVGQGPWSVGASFAVGTPPGVAAPVSPNAPASSNPPTFVWNHVLGAAQYELWVNGPTGQLVIHTYHAASAVCDATLCTVATSSSLAEGSYTWWTRASNAAGQGPWSAGQNFAIGFPPSAPSLLGPEGEQGSRPTYLWSAVPNAASYYLWVNGPTGTPVVQQTYAASAVCGSDGYCTMTPGLHLSDGAHTFWVQAINPVASGPWSASKTFNVRRGDLVRIAGGASHSLAITPQATLFSFGANTDGQLGDGSTVDRLVPTPVTSLSAVTTVSGGEAFSLSISGASALHAFGANSFGQFGDGSTTPSVTPVLVSGLAPANVAAGWSHALALMSDGTIRVMGANDFGQLGNGTTVASSTPITLGLTDVVGISAGGKHSAAVTRTGALFAWGGPGLTGSADGMGSLAPVAVAGVSDAVGVAAGETHTLVLRSNGHVLAFGSNAQGQLSDSTNTDRLTPVEVGESGMPFAGAVAMSAGASHSLILKTDGTVWAMGSSSRGQLGQGNTNSSSSVVQISIPVRIMAIAAGSFHSLALDVEGGLWAWGANDRGQLGDGTATDRLSPVRIADALMVFRPAAVAPTFTPGAGPYLGPLLVTATTTTPGALIHYTFNGAEPTSASPSVASGGTISIPVSGTLRGITTASGYVTSSTTTATYELVAAEATITPASGTYVSSVNVSISAGSGAIVYYTTDGQEPTTSSTPYSATFALTTSAIVKAKAFVTGWTSSATASASYTIKVADPVLSPASGKWYSQRTISVTTTTSGATMYYTTDGTEPTTSSPVVSGGQVVVNRPTSLKVKAFKTGAATSSSVRGSYLVTGQIVGAELHSTILKADGTVWTLGRDDFGAIGDGAPATQRLTPVQVSSLSNVIAIASGQYSSYALKSDGTVWAWGYNLNGRLGDGTTTDAFTPVQVTGLSGVTAIAAGGGHALALLSDGTVRSWGLGTSGELGRNSTTSSSTPVTVTGLSDVKALAAGFSHSLALKTNGAVLAWGAGFLGQVGDGTGAQRLLPVTVPGLVATDIASKGDSSYAILALGRTLKAWGSNASGQLGDGTTTNRLSPVTIRAGVRELAPGNSHLAFGTFDGRLWGVGANFSRQLGDGSPATRYLPIRSVLTRRVVTIGSGSGYSLTGVSTGEIWAAGLNQYGTLGLGNLTSPTVPTVIPSFALFSGTGLDVDLDGDGLDLYLEILMGTDPLLTDSNGNGLSDGDELGIGLEGGDLDSDHDGLSNAAEIIAGTDPFSADSDGDGALDGVDAFPLDPTKTQLIAQPGDTSAPVITLLRPTSATPIPD